MDKNKQIQKVSKLSLEKLSEDSKLIKRGLRDLSIWPKIEELFSKLKFAYENKQIEECIKIAEEILQTDANHFFTLCYYGRSLYLLERYETALKILDRCLEEEKDYYFLWSFMGDVYYKMSKYMEAVNAYDKSLKLELYEVWYRANGDERKAEHPSETPESTDLLENHMYYFDEDNSKNLDEIGFFRKAQSYLSTRAGIYNAYKENDIGIKRAIEALKKVIEINANNWYAKKQIVETLELLAEKKTGEDNKTAIGYIDEALTYDYDNSRLMAIKAILHDSLGDKKNAVEWIKKAKEKDPTNEDLDSVYQKINNLA